MKKITNLEIGTITYFLIRSCLFSICFNTLIQVSKQDSYISIIIGAIIGIIPLSVFYLLFNYEPSLNIFQKIKVLLGKYLGSIVNIILVLLIFSISVILFNDLITFIRYQYLDNTPIFIISIAFGLVIYYTLIKGINSILRASSIFFFMCIILFIISISGLIFKIDISNYTPSLINNYYRGSFLCLSYNLLPMILLLQIPKERIVQNSKSFKFIIVFYLIAILSVVMTLLSVIGIFGWKLSLLYNYPEFQILKYVYFKGLSSKLDSILYLQCLFDTVIYIIFSSFFIFNGVITILKKKRNIIRIIIPLLFIIFNEKISNIFLLKSLSFQTISNVIFIIITSILFILVISLLFKKEKPNKNSCNS
jgi:hypothetical protein